MNLTQKALALCALVALPISGVIAGQMTSSETATQITSEEKEMMTQTVDLVVKGMT